MRILWLHNEPRQPSEQLRMLFSIIASTVHGPDSSQPDNSESSCGFGIRSFCYWCMVVQPGESETEYADELVNLASGRPHFICILLCFSAGCCTNCHYASCCATSNHNLKPKRQTLNTQCQFIMNFLIKMDIVHSYEACALCNWTNRVSSKWKPHSFTCTRVQYFLQSPNAMLAISVYCFMILW